MAKPRDSLADHDQRAVGRRLKALHLAKGWEGKTFASMLKGGMTPQKLTNYESGTNMVPIDVAIRAGMLTGVDILFIYQGRFDNVDPAFAVQISNKLAEIEKAPKTRPRKRA